MSLAQEKAMCNDNKCINSFKYVSFALVESTSTDAYCTSTGYIKYATIISFIACKRTVRDGDIATTFAI